MMYIGIFICIYIYIYVYKHTHTHIHTHTHTHTHTHGLGKPGAVEWLAQATVAHIIDGGYALAYPNQAGN